MQVLGWLQPWLTDGFIASAFSKTTRASNPALVEQERRRSNANPPYMFKAFHRQVRALPRAEQHGVTGDVAAMDDALLHKAPGAA